MPRKPPTIQKVILDAIVAVHSGGTFFSRQVTTAVMDSFRKKEHSAAVGGEVELTPRELEVIKLIAAEFTTAEIGEKLFISHHTVESHRKNLLSKLGKKNTAGLVAWAVGRGLV